MIVMVQGFTAGCKHSQCFQTWGEGEGAPSHKAGYNDNYTVCCLSDCLLWASRCNYNELWLVLVMGREGGGGEEGLSAEQGSAPGSSSDLTIQTTLSLHHHPHIWLVRRPEIPCKMLSANVKIILGELVGWIRRTLRGYNGINFSNSQHICGRALCRVLYCKESPAFIEEIAQNIHI